MLKSQPFLSAGDESYPGTLHARVTYSLSADSLCMEYEATCDQATIVNLTNHAARPSDLPTANWGLKPRPTGPKQHLNVGIYRLNKALNDVKCYMAVPSRIGTWRMAACPACWTTSAPDGGHL